MQVAAAHIEKLYPQADSRPLERGGERRKGSGTVTTALIETDITPLLMPIIRRSMSSADSFDRSGGPDGLCLFLSQIISSDSFFPKLASPSHLFWDAGQVLTTHAA